MVLYFFIFESILGPIILVFSSDFPFLSMFFLVKLKSEFVFQMSYSLIVYSFDFYSVLEINILFLSGYSVLEINKLLLSGLKYSDSLYFLTFSFVLESHLFYYNIPYHPNLHFCSKIIRVPVITVILVIIISESL